MISIIVPVYNAENHLRTCLDSLLRQTYTDIEVICVDDGSQDKSDSILAGYSCRDSRFKLLTQENSGISSARNRGIEEAQGEWIMFVDSDDWIDITTCEKVMDLAEEYNPDVVFWSYIREFENERSSPRFLMNENKLFDEGNIQSLHRRIVGPVGQELRNPALLHSWGTAWGKLYTKNAISEFRFTDTKVIGTAEDALFNIEVFTLIKRALYINQPFYHYRKSRDSFTGGYNKDLNERWINLYTIISDIITANNLPADFHKALDNRTALGMIGQGINECRSSRNPLGKIAAIKHIIMQDHYRIAVQNLPLKYFPPHWYFFFQAVKTGKASILYLLLLIMKYCRFI